MSDGLREARKLVQAAYDDLFPIPFKRGTEEYLKCLGARDAYLALLDQINDSLAESDSQTPEDTERCTCDTKPQGGPISWGHYPGCPFYGSVPKRCPTCESTDPKVRDDVVFNTFQAGDQTAVEYEPCTDPWHSGSVQHGQGAE